MVNLAQRVILLKVALLFGMPVLAQPDSNRFQEPLRRMGLLPSDLAIRNDRWETAFTLPFVEGLLQNPVGVPEVIEPMAHRAAGAKSSAEWVRLSAELLLVSTAAPAFSSPAIPLSSHLRSALKKPVGECLTAIARAQTLLDQAVKSVPAKQRGPAVNAWRNVTANQANAAELEPALRKIRGFELAPLVQAAIVLTQAVDRVLPALTSNVGKKSRRLRWHTTLGDVLVAEGAQQEFSSKDLEGVVLLINQSSAVTYAGPVAAASRNQIRLVIDSAKDVTIRCGDSACAGSGEWGIGLLYLPMRGGIKRIEGGNASMGSGLFGVGGLWITGGQVDLSGGSSTQGSGTFGIGFCSVQSSPQAKYRARFAGQGVGFTQGIGLFRHEGDGGQFESGLSVADPREDQAITSMCLGMGYGPRAFAAGGVGIATLHGNHNHVASSYMTEGSGYWHGLGTFLLQGDDNEIQGRRYDQGTGVHTAVGAFLLEGNHNRVVNWGVGPGYGWDYGVGLFLSKGNENFIQADWATGHGEMNGLGLARIEGDRNQLILPQFGSGSISRNAPSYGLAAIQGQGNAMSYLGLERTDTQPLALYANPWGVTTLQGLSHFDSALKAKKVEWPAVDRASAGEKERIDLEKRLDRADKDSGRVRMEEWLAIASSFGLEQATPLKALQHLYTLPVSDIPYLVDCVSADRFDEFVFLRTVVAAYGPEAGLTLIHRIPSARGMNKILLLSLLSSTRIREAQSTVLNGLSDPDWRVRRSAVLVLGNWFDRENGPQPGRLRILEKLSDWLARTPVPAPSTGSAPRTVKKRTAVAAAQKQVAASTNAAALELTRLFGSRTIMEVVSIMALDPEMTPEDRWSLVSQNPDPFAVMNSTMAATWTARLLQRKEVYQKTIQEELRDSSSTLRETRNALDPLLNDPDPDVVQAVLIALGQMGQAEDAVLLANFLSNDRALIREAAATGLSKLGKAALEPLRISLRSSSVSARMAAVHAAVQSRDPDVVALLFVGSKDPDEGVSLASIVALGQLDEELKPSKERLAEALRPLADGGSSPSAQILINTLLGK